MTTNVTVREVIAAYLDNLQARLNASDLSFYYMRDCTADLGKFDAAVGPCLVSDAKQADLVRFLQAVTKSVTVRHRMTREIISCFRWAAEEELIDRVPFRRPKHLIRFACKPRREAKVPEYVALMRYGSRALRLAVYFLRRAPTARSTDMRLAKWADVYWDDGVIVLFKHKTSRITGKPKVIPIEDRLLRVLKSLHRRAADKEGNIFMNSDDRPWTADVLAQAVRRALNKGGLLGKAGDRATAYSLRHQGATNASVAGFSDRQIADLLGHSGTSLVSWYAKARERFGYMRELVKRSLHRERNRNR